MHLRRLSSILAGGLLASGACSSEGGGSSIKGANDTVVPEQDAGSADGLLNLPGQDPSKTDTSDQLTGTDLLPEGEECESVIVEATRLPADIYIMLDQSQSMSRETSGGVTRWDAVTSAIQAFVANDAADGIGVGIQYFGHEINDDCDPAKYATPDVEIQQLPSVRSEIEESLSNTIGPFSKTPTYPALEGALMHAAAYAVDHEDRQTIVVLATDGFPSECELSLAAIGELAATGYAGTPSVLTSVIAIAEGESNANLIASEGGGKAFVIEDEEDVENKFLEAMLNIVSDPLGCHFEIPEHDPESGEVLDFDRVAVSFESESGRTLDVPKVNSRQDCAPAGWYTNSPTDATHVEICPETCEEFGAGVLSIRFGCKDEDDVTIE